MDTPPEQLNNDNVEKKQEFNLFDYYSLFNEDIVLSYKGPFDKKSLSVFGGYIRTLISHNQRISKKLFSIFIEIAQNISYYSAEKNELIENSKSGIGGLIIINSGNYYLMITGNLVYNKDVYSLIDKCETINNLNRDELRQFKRKQRHLPKGDYGGANIGLIQIALTSANPLDIEVIPMDDEKSFFALVIRVEK